MTNEPEMLKTALRILQEYGVPAHLAPLPKEAAGRDGVRPDGRLQLKIGDEYRCFDVECKKWLKPGNLGGVAAQLGACEYPGFLVTDHVTAPMAERLRDLQIPFLDMAGNAWLEMPPVIIRVEGRKPAERAEPPPRNRAFQPTGLQVLFALLCRPELFRAPLREIADATGVAHGTVGWVMQGLRDRGYLVERGKGRGRKRVPRHLVRLLDEWATEYARTLRPALLIGRYAPARGAKPDWWRNLDLRGDHVLLGAEPAAAELTDHLQPGTITLYAERLPGRVIARQRMEKDDRGTIEFRRRFWHFDHQWQRPDLVPPVLIYADLLATDEPRCVETARMIHERYLARPLAQY